MAVRDLLLLFCASRCGRIFPPRDGHAVDKLYYVYILASRSRNLYTGVTNSLLRRVIQHRLGLKPGFTSKYKIFWLVYFEIFGDIRLAIAREKEIKAWRREKKVWLIDKHNPTWADLTNEWFGKTGLQPAKPTAPQSLKTAAKATADPSPPSKSRPGSGLTFRHGGRLGSRCLRYTIGPNHLRVRRCPHP